ncbi:MAG: hypothetical protein M0Z68_08240 [Gammaproteobacteria bacterium]|nr:hypothetical protein [Gammaproteobacteria bacterium]
MPGFDAKQLAYGVRNGNMVNIMLGELSIGFGQTSSASNDWGTEALYGIGSAKPQEIQQLRIEPTVSLDSFQLTKKGLAFLGYPSSMLEVLSNNSFDFHIMDENANAILTYVGCVAQNFNLNIPANQPITEAVSFTALDILNALGVSILNSNQAIQTIEQAALMGTALNLAGL